GRRALSRRSSRGSGWRRGTVFGQARDDTAPQSAQCGPGRAVNDRPSGNVEHQLANAPTAQENRAILLAGNIENALGEAYGKGEAGRARSPEEKHMFRAGRERGHAGKRLPEMAENAAREHEFGRRLAFQGLGDLDFVMGVDGWTGKSRGCRNDSSANDRGGRIADLIEAKLLQGSRRGAKSDGQKPC